MRSWRARSESPEAGADIAKFDLALDRAVLRTLERLSRGERLPLAERIAALTDEPLPDGVQRKKLAGVSPPLYRLRVGPWRALYRIDGRTVKVVDLVRRRDLEAWMRRRGR